MFDNKSFEWIKNHKTWTLFLVLSLLSVLYIGYSNFWQPFEMLMDAKLAVGKTVDFTKDVIEFITQKSIIEFIKVLTPLLLPIITWKIKSKMDENVRQTTNKVVRDKLKIGNRRKSDKTVINNKRKK